MRLVEWIAEDGLKHLSWLRDRDPDEEVSVSGVPHDPPALDSLYLSTGQALTLHNALVEHRLIAWQNSIVFKNGLQSAAQAAGLDAGQTVQLLRLYTNGPAPRPELPFDLQRALDDLPYTDRQRDCIKRSFAQAGIRCLADVHNAPTRVGHICKLDIYLIVAQLTGKPPT